MFQDLDVEAEDSAARGLRIHPATSRVRNRNSGTSSRQRPAQILDPNQTVGVTGARDRKSGASQTRVQSQAAAIRGLAGGSTYNPNPCTVDICNSSLLRR